jgi:hypothetical protein
MEKRITLFGFCFVLLLIFTSSSHAGFDPKATPMKQDPDQEITAPSTGFVEEFGNLPGVTDSTWSALQAHLEKGEKMEAPDSAWMAENVRLMRLMALEHRISLGEAMLNDTVDEAKRAQIQQKLKELREEEKRLNKR